MFCSNTGNYIDVAFNKALTLPKVRQSRKTKTAFRREQASETFSFLQNILVTMKIVGVE